MKRLYVEDSEGRQHYIMERKSYLNIKSKLLYSGSLSKVKGWHVKPHSHNFVEILFVQEGEGVVCVDGKEFTVQTGDIVIYNECVKHQEISSVKSPLEISFIAFDNVQLKDMPPNCIAPVDEDCIYNAGRELGKLKEFFRVLKNEITVKDDFYAEIAENISCMILSYILRIVNSNQKIANPLYSDKSIEKILNYIEEHYLENISLGEIAKECYITKYHLSHLFTEQIGVSVKQYILNKKLDFAKTMLRETDLHVNKIAEKCGFNDVSYFARTFKKHVNVTPVKYRSKNNNKI